MKAGLVIEPRFMIIIVSLDIRQIAHGLRRLRHAWKRMKYPFVLPFSEGGDMNEGFLQHHELDLRIGESWMGSFHFFEVLACLTYHTPLFIYGQI